MDAIDVLTDDHRMVEDLFVRFEGTSDCGRRRELVERMVERLMVHDAVEEQELYPVMRRAITEEQLVDEAVHEHAQAKALMAALLKVRPDAAMFEPMVRELIADVRHHVQEEEHELFPLLRERVQQAELTELGQRLERAKRDAPRRPSATDLRVLDHEELRRYAHMAQLDSGPNVSKDELAARLVSA